MTAKAHYVTFEWSLMKVSLIENLCWDSERDRYRGIVPLQRIQGNKQFLCIVYRGIFYSPVLDTVEFFIPPYIIQGNKKYRGIILKNVAIVQWFTWPEHPKGAKDKVEQV